jgi:mannan endo-1,4-beta-mannosidase
VPQTHQQIQTRSKVLNYLYSISGSKTVAGQHNREPIFEPAKWTNAIHETTGKYPGLWSSDFLFEQDSINNRQTMIDEVKRQWNQGVIVNLMYHACPPTQSESCEWEGGVKSHLSDSQWNELITDGTELNNIWKSRLDRIAVFLNDLKNSGVEVLWRPFHEMNQGNFWWGGRPGSNGTRKLYQLTHDYLVNIKGLTNLIWVWDMQDFENLSQDLKKYNPGDSYWDVAALDIYGSDGQLFTEHKYRAMMDIAGGKPIAIGECDKLPTSDELAAQPFWTFFMAWAELVSEKNSEQEIHDLYNANNVLTCKELPGWENFQ